MGYLIWTAAMLTNVFHALAATGGGNVSGVHPRQSRQAPSRVEL